MKAELVPENGDPPIPIVRDVTVLGRHRDCDVVIEHPSLSKRHCLLVKTDGLLVIRDLATTNGTKVKGQRVRWAALLPEDRVSFGAYKMRIYLGSDEMLSPSEQRQLRDGALGSDASAATTIRPAGPARPAGMTGSTAPTPKPKPKLSPAGSPEVSSAGAGAAGRGDRLYESARGKRPAANEPVALSGGFELVDDEEPDGAGGAGAIEGGFELVEDSDEIVELE